MQQLIFILPLIALLGCRTTSQPEAIPEENLQSENNNQVSENNSQGNPATDQQFMNPNTEQGNNADFAEEDSEGEESNQDFEPNAQAAPVQSNTQANAKAEVTPEKPASPVVAPPPQPTPVTEFPIYPLKATRRILAGGEAPIEYVVEPFDNLATICDQLLDDPGYWPKLWSLNPYIKNPHMIYPGMRLTFYPGDEEKAPYMAVAAQDDLLPLDENGESAEFSNMLNEPIYIKSEAVSIVPTEVLGMDDIPKIDAGLTEFGNIYDQKSVEITVPGFMLPEIPTALCTVVMGLGGQQHVADNDGFMCLRAGEDLQPQTLYTVLRFRNSATSVSGQISYIYHFVGNVELSSIGDDQAIGKVVQSRLNLTKNDIIVPYMSTRRSINHEDHGTLSTGSAQIIAFDEDGQQLGGEGQFAYINRGTQDGLENYQIMRIYESSNHPLLDHYRQGKTLDLPSIGLLKLIDVREHGAVGYIVNNEQEVWIGDVLGENPY